MRWCPLLWVFLAACAAAETFFDTVRPVKLNSTEDVTIADSALWQQTLTLAGSFEGKTMNVGSKLLNGSGAGDAFVAAFDAESGGTIWAQTFGGVQREQALAVTAINDVVIVAGTFSGQTISFGPSVSLSRSDDDTDIFIVACARDSGVAQWSRGFSTTPLDAYFPVVLSSNASHITMAGSFVGSLQIGNNNLQASTVYDRNAFVVLLDGAGQIIWAKQFGGSGIDYSSGIHISGSNIFLSGTFSSSHMQGMTNQGLQDAFVIKMTAAGSVIWAKGLGGSSADYGGKIEAYDGSAYVTGRFSGTIYADTANMTSVGGSDVFAARLSGSGQLAWLRRFGGTQDDYVTSLTVRILGQDLFIAGTYASPTIQSGSTTIYNAGGGDMYMASLSLANGQTLSATSYGGSASDTATAISAHNYNLFLSGSFKSSSIAFHDVQLTQTGSKAQGFSILQIPAFTYASETLHCTVGTRVENVPSWPHGTYFVIPSLPNGFEFNQTTGKIIGTPLSPLAIQSYHISAETPIGSSAISITISVIDLPPLTLQYSGAPYDFTQCVDINPNLPSYSGGAVVTYGVSPSALPSGITFDTTTGAFWGRPLEVKIEAFYIVTASNTGGSSSTTVGVAVDSGGIGSFHYTSAKYHVGTRITVNQPAFECGFGSSFSVSPKLPDGLSLSSSSGNITGIPQVVTAEVTYTITAATAQGTHSSSQVLLTVVEAIPTGLTCVSKVDFQQCADSSEVNLVTPVGSTGISTYYMVPQLPSGLVFDSAKASVLGKALVSTVPILHILIGASSGGTTNCSLVVSVSPSDPQLEYPGSPISIFFGAPMVPVVPSICGVDSVTIHPKLPTGLSMSSNGVISGTPEVSGQTSHTVQVANNNRLVTVELGLTIEDGPQIHGWIRVSGLPPDALQVIKYQAAFKTAIATIMGGNVSTSQITLTTQTVQTSNRRTDDWTQVEYTVVLNTRQSIISQALSANIDRAANENGGAVFVAAFKRAVEELGDFTLSSLPMSTQAGHQDADSEGGGAVSMLVLIVCSCLVCIFPYWKRIALCCADPPKREPGMITLLLLKNHCWGIKSSPIAPLYIHFPRAQDVEHLTQLCKSHLALEEVELMECQFDDKYVTLSDHGTEEDIAFENCKRNFMSNRTRYIEVWVQGKTAYCAVLGYMFSCKGICGSGTDEDTDVETEMDSLETTVMLPPEKSDLSRIISNWSSGVLPPQRQSVADNVFDLFTHAAGDELLALGPILGAMLEFGVAEVRDIPVVDPGQDIPLSREEFHEWLSEHLGLVTLQYYENVMTFVAMSVERVVPTSAKVKKTRKAVMKREDNPLADSEPSHPAKKQSVSETPIGLSETSEVPKKRKKKKTTPNDPESLAQPHKTGVASKKKVGKKKVTAYTNML